MKKEPLYHTLDYAFRKSLEKLKDRESSAAIVDLYLFPNPDSGDFTIFDDENNVLVQLSVPAWEEQFQGFDTDAALKESESSLREIVNQVKEEGLYENLNILKPFSVLLVDEEMEVITELLTIDEEQLLLNDDFLKHMDEELDGFYKQLMSDL
jgi:hypothetical protein